MLEQKLKSFDLILASGSPRRQNLFAAMGLPHRIEVRSIDEVYPEDLKAHAITDFLALKKADAFAALNPNQIIVTCDTIVWHNHRALEKPKDKTHALEMLSGLCGDVHEVFTSVCIKTEDQTTVFNDRTQVWIDQVSMEDLRHYVNHYEPLDKAGGYGIQDFFGFIGVSKIEGCYYNVMGLPTRLVYQNLRKLVKGKTKD